MAQELKYYDVQTAAAILGITPAEVNQLREQNKLRGFRDGATWKFRVEDVHQLRKTLQLAAKPEESAEEVLAAEPERAPGDLSGSGSVLGLDSGGKPGDTDLTLRRPEDEEELQLVDAEPGQVHAPPPVSESAEDLLPLAEADFTLSDDSVASISKAAPAEGFPSSRIELGEESALAPSGGSDVKIGHDSGISLLDPHDSGLSLEEEPVVLAASEDEIALGEDEMLTIAADSAAAAGARPDVEFQLTPSEDEYGLEDSESASQVIALVPGRNQQRSATLWWQKKAWGRCLMNSRLGGGSSDPAGRNAGWTRAPRRLPEDCSSGPGGPARGSLRHAGYGSTSSYAGGAGGGRDDGHGSGS